MHKKYVKAAAVALLSSIAVSAYASTGVLLTPAEIIDKRCESDFRTMGIYCQKEGEPAPTIAPHVFGIPMAMSERQLFDPQNMRVAAILHLKSMRTDHGFSYYTATVEPFKSNFLGNGFSPTDRFENAIWKYLSDVGVSSANAGSDVELKYLADQDGRLERKQAHAEALKAAREQMQAQLDYAQSPAGRKEAAVKAVADCHRTIEHAKAAIAQDQRVASISGYENKLLREQAAVAIVNCQDTIARGGYPSSQ